MHSSLSRVSAVCSYAFTVLGLLLVAIAFSDRFLQPATPAHAVATLVKLHESNRGIARAQFDLDVGTCSRGRWQGLFVSWV